MQILSHLFQANFGVVKTAQLTQADISARHINKLARSGQIQQLRRGWWSCAGANQQVVAAVRAGGVLTGPSALALRGAWLPPKPHLHVRTAHAQNLHGLPNHAIHRLPDHLCAPCSRSCDNMAVSLFVTMHDVPPIVATAITDSVLNRGLLDIEQVNDIAQLVGPRGLEVLSRVDPCAESGSESVLRMWLRAHGLSFASQVIIDGVGRVDFLVGTSLVIEVDSRAHHTGEAQYANDRRRDRILIARGYTVIRLTYEDVVFGMDEAGADILKVVREGRHRRPVSE